MTYILESLPFCAGFSTIFDGYYTGNTYRFQGETYAVCDLDIENAKKYKSLKIAENACKSLNNKSVNYQFRVFEIVEKCSKEHPKKTILDDFMEKYPNALMTANKFPKCCVKHLGYRVNCINTNCLKCWHTPLEEVEDNAID